MLSFSLQGPGAYAARDGEKTLGLCRFEGQGEATLIHALQLGEADADLCDGLLRATLFYGLRLGRTHYRIDEAAAAPHRELLQALGIPQQGMVEELPHHCACGR